MTATARRFIRRTTLHADEYRTNFRQIDCDVIATLTSDEAALVTSQMSKVYLRLVNAPTACWEREGVLRFTGGEIDGKFVTAWEQLTSLAGVASATARKALRWMSEQGIIGYYAGRNGVGIRIFINRAASSVGHKAKSDQKNLRLVDASTRAARTSRNDVPFNDSFAVLENLDTDINPGAPKTGAEHEPLDKKSPEPDARESNHTANAGRVENQRTQAMPDAPTTITVQEIVTRLRRELEPAMHVATRQAAAREHERTREWLETRGLPKAARVAQHEAYNVLRKHGLFNETTRSAGAHADVGRREVIAAPPHPLDTGEIAELAGACLAMLETKGQSIERTLAGMSAEAGGFLLPEDAMKVREKTNSLLASGHSREGK